MLVPAAVHAQVVVEPDRGNPELEVLVPWENGPFLGFFLVETKNITYLPELATNPGTQFNVGVDLLGDALRFGEGHLHGWVFRLNRNGELIRDDGPLPSPAAYARFYGAGGAEFFGNEQKGYYFKTDDLKDLRRGRYRVFFQAQQNDHTAMTQISAPAFPAIASRDFWVW
jgi:hypothetical protein